MSETSRLHLETPAALEAEFQAIVHRQLTPETINDYAEVALEDLTRLANLAVSVYQQYPVVMLSSQREVEDAAFSYFDVGRIDEALDHITSQAVEIGRLDNVIDNANMSHSIIVPPDSVETHALSGQEKFEAKKNIPRLKTLLYILKNDFSVDVEDESQVDITVGEVNEDMFRNESYYIVDVKRINRVILVCDEEGNVTYVFDREGLLQQDISADQLRNMSKTEINRLLRENKMIGQRLVYSEYYVPRVVSALVHPETSASKSNTDPTAGRYLVPKAPDDVHSLVGVRKLLGIRTQSVIQKAVEDLVDVLGDVRTYRFGTRSVLGFTEHQQEIIRMYLDQQGYFNSPPAGYLNKGNLHTQWRTAYPIIDRAIAALGTELGDARTYMANRGQIVFYNPTQQELIRAKLETMGMLHPNAPEGYLSTLGLAKALGVDHSTIVTAVVAISDSLGDVYTYKFSNQSTSGYSPTQQSKIRSQIENQGLLVKVAPEGVLSIEGLGMVLGFPTSRTVRRVVASLGTSLGTIDNFRFGARKRVAQGLTVDQQMLVKETLRLSGELEIAPEDFAHTWDISTNLGVGYRIVLKIVDMLAEEIGTTQKYRAASGATTYFSPSQQAVIKRGLSEYGYLDNLPPKNYLPINGLAKKLGVSHSVVTNAIARLSDVIGDVRTYKFKTRVTPGLTPLQQELIEAEIRR